MSNKHTLLIAGGALAVLAIALLLIFARLDALPKSAAKLTAAATATQPTQVAVTGQMPEGTLKPAGLYDAELAIAAMQKGGCGACHIIPGVPNAVSTIGPNLTNATAMIEAHLQEGRYTGSAKTVEEFLHESIVSPDAFLAPDCGGAPCQKG